MCAAAGALAVAWALTSSDDDGMNEGADDDVMKDGIPVCSRLNRVNILDSMLSKPGENRGSCCGEKRGSCLGWLKLDGDEAASIVGEPQMEF